MDASKVWLFALLNVLALVSCGGETPSHIVPLDEMKVLTDGDGWWDYSHPWIVYGYKGTGHTVYLMDSLACADIARILALRDSIDYINIDFFQDNPSISPDLYIANDDLGIPTEMSFLIRSYMYIKKTGVLRISFQHNGGSRDWLDPIKLDYEFDCLCNVEQTR